MHMYKKMVDDKALSNCHTKKRERVLRFIYLSGKTPSKINVFSILYKYFNYYLLVVLLLLNLCNFTFSSPVCPFMIYLPPKFQSLVLFDKAMMNITEVRFACQKM